MRPFPFITLLSAILSLAASAAPAPLGLKVSENKRHLITATGEPFFWLGDTAWELFHRLNREDAEIYLKNRAALGYTIIQAVALAELDGLTEKNPYGHLPLEEQNSVRPAIKDGPDNDYWDHVDWIVEKANAEGLTIGFLPTWGDKWNKKWGTGPELFTPENAEVYGAWLGQRYKNRSIIWILGGDRPVETDLHREITKRMAQGLRKGDGGAHLITYHPNGGNGSAEYFHDQPWLDFNMRQNGHVAEFTGRYDKTRQDYDRSPAKPVLDAEPIYEGHPINFKAKEYGHSLATDVRRPLYWNLFSGACGHTYGHHSVWQMYDPARGKPVNAPLMSWKNAINEPGASQMQHGRHLMESRPFLNMIPDQSIIVTDAIATSVPGAGRYYFAAARTTDGSCAMVYVPGGRKFSLHMDKITDPKVRASWFNPRDGTASAAGEYPNTATHEFTPPSYGEVLDWILVLDAAGKNYSLPGRK